MARRILAILVVLVVLAGCGGSAEEPKTTPSTTPTPTVATPTAPVLPEAAKANTKAGAEAFVRHYVDLLNVVQSGGSSEAARSVSLNTCRSCDGALDKVEGLYSAGATIEGGRWMLRSTSVSRPTQAGGATPTAVVLTEIEAAKQVVRQPGKAPVTYPAGPVKYFFTLSWTKAGWKVAAWDPV